MFILGSTYRIFSVSQDVPLHDSGGGSKREEGGKSSEDEEELGQHDCSAIVRYQLFKISLHLEAQIGPLCIGDWRQLEVNGPTLSNLS